MQQIFLNIFQTESNLFMTDKKISQDYCVHICVFWCDIGELKGRGWNFYDKLYMFTLNYMATKARLNY
jgi:hypothetical protein